MSTEELLAKYGIKLASTAAGRYYTTCPKCSAKRSRENQKKECLGVTIEADGKLHFGCNHCDFRGPEKGNGKQQGRPELPSYVYCDVDGAPRFRKVRNAPGREPRFWLERADGNGWLKGTKGVDTKILYRLDEVTKGIAEGRIIACVEGEKDADNLWAIGIAATCNAHGASEPGKAPKWMKAHSRQIAGADIVVFNDNDPAGYEHADSTCKLSLGVAKRVRRLDLARHWPEIPKGGDVSDWLALGHTCDELQALIEQAPDYEPPPGAKEKALPPEPTEVDIEITRLAKLTWVEYGQQRKDAAQKLGVSSVSILDKAVAAERTKLGLDGDDGKQGHAIEFPDPEPWPQPVNGAELLDDLATAIRRHVVLADHVRDACALWAAHTYLVNCFLVSPRLAIRSAVKGCGKTTLLDVLEHLAAKPLRTSSVTASVTFRLIEAHQPSLLIDEADKILNEDRRDLLGILNDGHRRGGRSVRNVPIGDGYEPRAFATFSALAIALIGSPPAELYDRSVVVDLKRRLPTEAVEQLRIGRTAHLEVFPRRLARWAKDHAAVVAAADPKMPDGIFNREADNWLPLLAIADAAGGQWPERARKAAQASHNVHTEGASRLELLLGDIREVFGSKTEMPSADLVEDLVALDGHPWKETGRARKPLTQNGLARMLKPLGIAPGLIGLKRLSGYKQAQFKEAFERYLPSEGDPNLSPSHNAANTGTSDDSQPLTEEAGREVEKCKKPNNDGLMRGREVAEGADRDEGRICAFCNQPGGNQVSFGDGCIWLHRACENPWIDRRMGEEGIRQ